MTDRAYLVLVATVITTSSFAADKDAPKKKAQYESGDIRIVVPSPDEKVREKFSKKDALDYIERGAIAWSEKRGCVTCHTNGAYLQLRPALTPTLGPPSERVRKTFVEQLRKFEKMSADKKRSGLNPTQIAYVANGLTAWDRHVTKKQSPEAKQALVEMMEAQAENGSFSNLGCWPPLESSEYHGATVAAMALANALDFAKNADTATKAKIEKLEKYLRETKPPHDYGKALLLWTAARVPGLIDDAKKNALIDRLFALQRSDGGWSLHGFASPEAWGDGSRAKRIRKQPEFETKPSDGHQTGLCVLVLREAGVPADDPRIRRACDWLLKNQRESGRWWTRSLNNDRFHYISYTSTLYPIAALHSCGLLSE